LGGTPLANDRPVENMRFGGTRPGGPKNAHRAYRECGGQKKPPHKVKPSAGKGLGPFPRGFLSWCRCEGGLNNPQTPTMGEKNKEKILKQKMSVDTQQIAGVCPRRGGGALFTRPPRWTWHKKGGLRQKEKAAF